ncbi:glycosyltransferase, family 4 [Campylobacter lari]|uniref:glycosyltransferase n=1 Tax=Campylobacter lari TaxID=201 RepID=UPI0021523FB6|nr:glycosyltransferase [Campylobacter lari]MCR6536025.1 glycosyltransferase [Campylobacter lari]
MKKILLITPELEYTGALNSFKRICEVLLNNNYDVEIWSYRRGPFIEEFDRLGVYVEIVEEKNIDLDWIHQRIDKYVLVIANTVVVYKAVELLNDLIPVVWYIREAENLPDFFWKPQRKVALMNARKLYVVSEYAKKFIVNNYNTNVKVLHNYVDDFYYKIKPKQNKNKVKFLSLGTIEKRKGYDVLLDAFIGLPNEIREQCELHFAGRLWDGAKNFYPKILSLSKQYGNIYYHGELREKNKIYQLIADSSVVVVPSRDESCSLVALEGAMMSKPLILTKNIGAQYILNQNNGWLIETGNTKALLDAFVSAYRNKDKLSDMGLISRENYLQTSTYEIYEKNILQMVENEICENQYMYRIAQAKYELFSFDIFDTLIARSVDSKMVFRKMKDKMNAYCFPNQLVENFDLIRIQTEQYFYQNICREDYEDVSIDEIYNTIQCNYSLSNEQKNILLKLEIDAEKEVIYPIEQNIFLVEKLVSESKRVVLISDMYLPENVIREILLRFSSVFKKIPIYVSCDHNCKKNNGKLFKKILELEQIEPAKWMHYGDNWNGDYLQASQLGINVFFYKNTFTANEIFALEKDYFNPSIQAFVGISRKIRAENTFSSLKEIGISYGGPLLLPYVYWILNTAVKNNIRTLYFVARDGYILKKIADILIEKERLNISTKYIYGSREAWREPFRCNDLEKIEKIKNYLQQEIDCKANFAFVECCGTGETLDYIIKMLQNENVFNKRCFGSLYLYRSKLPNFESKSLFMIPLNRDYTYLVELFMRSMEGQVLYFDQNGEKVIPICDVVEEKAFVQFRYNEYIDGVVLFVENIVKMGNYKSYLNDYNIVLLYLKYLKDKNIDKKIVELLGGIPFVLDGKKEYITTIAPRNYSFNQKDSTYRPWYNLRNSFTYKNNTVDTFSAVEIVKSHLSYKLGQVVILNIKNPLKWWKLFIVVPSLIIWHREEKLQKQHEKIDINRCKDYLEAIRVKNFFSYQLGNSILKTFKKWNIFAVFVLPFSIFRLYSKKMSKKEKQ